MSGKFRVNDIAEILKVSQTTIYKRFASMKERLKPHSYREKGIIFFDNTALELFRNSITTADKESVEIETLKNIESQGLADIHKSIMLLIEAHRGESDTIREEISRLIDENRKLTNQIAILNEKINSKEKPFRDWYRSFFRHIPAQKITIKERYDYQTLMLT